MTSVETVSSQGTVYESYSHAVQNGSADTPDDCHVLGVVRRETPWFCDVDENVEELAPPEDLLDDFHDRREELEDEMDDVTAHNKAFWDVRFVWRYVKHVSESDEAQSALDRIQRLLECGEDVCLVCYESDVKSCHRMVLIDVFLAEYFADDAGDLVRTEVIVDNGSKDDVVESRCAVCNGPCEKGYTYCSRCQDRGDAA